MESKRDKCGRGRGLRVELKAMKGASVMTKELSGDDVAEIARRLLQCKMSERYRGAVCVPSWQGAGRERHWHASKQETLSTEATLAEIVAMVDALELPEPEEGVAAEDLMWYVFTSTIANKVYVNVGIGDVPKCDFQTQAEEDVGCM